MKEKRKVNQIVLILIAVVLGIICALIFGEKIAFLAPIGKIWINLIRMICIPLVMCSIISAITSMNDMKRIGRVGGKMLVWYVGTTLIFAIFGIVVGMLWKPGLGVEFQESADAVVGEAPTLLEVFLNMVPTNIFESMASGSTLPCIVFSVFFGFAIIMIGEEKSKPVLDVIRSCTEIFYKIINIIMKGAPIGIFCLLSSNLGKSGKDVLSAFASFIIVQYVCGIVCLAVHISMATIGGGIPAKQSLSAFGRVIATAFSTRSSSATLPVTLDTAVTKLGCDESIAQFMLPIGATINMNGDAISFAIKAVFAGFLYGQPLTLGQCAMAVGISVIACIGTPGIPSAGTVMNILLFSTLGFPTGTLIGIMSGIGALGDMIFTSCNVCGDLACTTVISRSERRRSEKKA